MGSHRADSPAPRRRAAGPADQGSTTASTYVGKRVAGRTATVGAAPVLPTPVAAETVRTVTPLAPRLAPAAVRSDRLPTVELPALSDIAAFDPMTDSSTSQLKAIQPAGKRRAERHAGPRGPLFKGLPPLPVVVGVATLAVAIGGAVSSADTQLTSSSSQSASANAMTGTFGNGTVSLRQPTVSRASDRDTLEQASGTDLVAQAERHAEERNSALGELTQAAEKEAAEIALNRWVLPLDNYRLTATFGEYGLWSSYHTGLDFAAPSGTHLRAITNGVITSVGYDGAYGNKTVLTLEDGTELWYCHQSATEVSVGDTVRTGDLIGYVGSTGHVTGPHLHLEVRPGGGDPVNPDAALRVHGVTP